MNAGNHSLFAVWHWPKRVWIAGGLLSAYFLSPPVLDQVWLNTTVNPMDAKPSTLIAVESPLLLLARYVRPVAEFYQREWDVIDMFTLSPGYIQYTEEDEEDLPEGVVLWEDLSPADQRQLEEEAKRMRPLAPFPLPTAAPGPSRPDSTNPATN